MNEKIIAYLYDFLSMVFEEGDIKDKIEEIIVFGSVARGSFDKKSDIDLFFNVKNAEESAEIERVVRRIQKSFEVKAEKTWGLKKIKLPMSIIVGSLKDKTWEALKEEITSSGIILYSTYKEIPEKLNHNYLLYYSLTNLSRKNKMKFIRRLFGYSQKIMKKEYRQKGFLEEISGLKLASNALLVPAQEVKKIKDVFKEFKVEYNIIEAWIRL